MYLRGRTWSSSRSAGVSFPHTSATWLMTRSIVKHTTPLIVLIQLISWIMNNNEAALECTRITLQVFHQFMKHLARSANSGTNTYVYMCVIKEEWFKLEDWTDVIILRKSSFSKFNEFVQVSKTCVGLK
eukprot:jgi/Botrbrau1/19410/Bobra.0338s0037.1